MRHGFDRGVVVGIALLALMMVGIAVTSDVNTRSLRKGADDTAKSREIIDAIGTVRTDVRKLQAELRSYLITGFPDWVKPYEEATATLRADAITLSALTDRDPEQRPRARAVGQEIDDGITGFDMVVKLRGGPDGYNAVIALSRERGRHSFVDPLLETLAEMDRAERERLAVRERAARAAYDRAIFYGIAASLLGLAVLGTFVWWLRRSVRARARDAARLADQRELLNATLTSIGDAVIATDAGGNVTFLNAVAEALTGWTRADAGGVPLTNVFNIINEASRTPVENPAHRALKEGSIVGLANHTILIAKDGTEHPIDDSAAPIRSRGVITGAVLVFRDISERHVAAKKLADSEKRHRMILESITDAFFAVNRDWKFTYLNPQAERFLDRKETELLGKDMWEEYPGLLGTEFGDTYRRAMAANEVFTFTALHPVRKRWFEVHTYPSLDGLTIYFRNVTDKKLAEEQERRTAEADAKFRTFFDQSTQFAGVMSVDGTVVEANRLCLDACGFARDDVLGKKFWECGWWNRSPALVEMVRRGSQEAAGGQIFRTESPYFWADGTERIVDLIIAPVTDETGRVLFIAPTGTDITDRKRADESIQFLADASASLAELVDSESTLGRIAKLAVGGFADWCVVDVLDEVGTRRRLAVTSAEPVAVTAGDLVFGPDAPVGVPHVLRTGEPEVVPDLDQVDPATAAQGAERIERLRARGVRSYLCVPLLSRGRVIGGMTFLGASVRHHFGPEELRVAQELARRVTSAIENATLYRTLQEQDRRKDEFLATLAHELRNPLAPVRNGVQILRVALPNDPRTGRTLDMMERQLGHMVHMIDDLMDVARVSSGKVVLRKERVELRALVTSAVETSRQVIEGAGHEFALRVPPEALVLEADGTRLSQVLSNLLNNAAKYTPHGGRVELSVERDGNRAVVRVTDTGVGIPPEMLPQIFDMFTQVGTSLDRAQGGLGIGLTLVKRLVEMHGGTVTARSAGAGRGSEFSVRLPLVPGALEAPPSAPGNGVVPTRTKLAVLVVDDNRDAAESLGILLEIKGHEVKTAHDGPEALRVLETFRPNLIVLDIGLPGMSGYEVAKRIRASEGLKGVTLAALTGWGQEEDRRRTKEAGFDHHMVKPADPVEVEKILSAVSRS